VFFCSFFRLRIVFISDGDSVSYGTSPGVPTLQDPPSKNLRMGNPRAHAINKTRDGFSGSHFGEETERWLAYYMRDLVNTQIRLLLHFM